METKRQVATEESRVEWRYLLKNKKKFSVFLKKIYFYLPFICIYVCLYFPHKYEYSCGPEDSVGSPVAEITGS